MVFKLCILSLFLSCGLASSTLTTKPAFIHEWSKDLPAVYPGGTYKFTNIQTVPSWVGWSAALYNLFPGGVRELHWHNTTEWAIVLKGTCRFTVMENGKGRAAETWDFVPGDVWYVRSNEGHMIQGLADGCTFITSFDDEKFEDRSKSLGLSSLISSWPASVAAQALGVSEGAELNRLVAANALTFLPLGPVPNTTLDQYRASIGRPAQQPVLQTHRFNLYNLEPEVSTAGGSVRIAQVSNFPISTDISGALLRFAPGATRQLHWHPKSSELQYIINGTFTEGVFNGPGMVEEGVLHTGDTAIIPKGAAHWMRNESNDTDAYVLAMFDDGVFTNIDLPWFLGNTAPEIVATSMNTSEAFARTINYKAFTMVPARAAQNAPVC